jgi:uncharacterized protein with HEPN domain
MPRKGVGEDEADRVRLRHMLDAARRAVAFVGSKAVEDLRADDMGTLGLVKCIEIIGEAASKVGDASRAKIPGIPWRSVVGMRNRTVHGYDQVNLGVVWDTATRDLPTLIGALEAYLGPGDGGPAGLDH